MIATSKYLVLLVGLLAFQPMLAQAEDPDPVKDLKPPKNRELFHDFVDKQQKDILSLTARLTMNSNLRLTMK